MPRQERFGGTFHFFAKGDFGSLILHALEDKPMHGYEIMKAIEERFHGFYKPSPGTIYPALKALGKRGYVSVVGDNHRKTYRISAAGKRHLRNQHTLIVKRIGAFESAVGPERAALFRELRATGKLLGTNIKDVTPAQAKRLRGVMVRMRKEILKVLSE
ncbi:MAG TPA: PadR family transcriptional regulator [Thermoplasmata archaeon]|jgi:DNA-binding PadR family transcriptional regulator|nr:PadR family transcriptional regulator [Thermoplasmata archaeon]